MTMFYSSIDSSQQSKIGMQKSQKVKIHFVSPVASKWDLDKGDKWKYAWNLEIESMTMFYSSIDSSQESKIGM